MNPNQNSNSKYCQTKKAIFWFYWDFSKRTWNTNDVGIEEMRHTLWKVDMCKCQKNDLKAQMKSLLLDCTWLENSLEYIYMRDVYLMLQDLILQTLFFWNQEIIEELFFFSFFYGDHLVFLLSFFWPLGIFFLSLFLFASSKIYFYFWNMTALHPHSWMILALEYKQQLNKRIEVFETKYLPLFLSLFLIL